MELLVHERHGFQVVGHGRESYRMLRECGRERREGSFGRIRDLRAEDWREGLGVNPKTVQLGDVRVDKGFRQSVVAEHKVEGGGRDDSRKIFGKGRGDIRNKALFESQLAT